MKTFVRIDYDGTEIYIESHLAKKNKEWEGKKIFSGCIASFVVTKNWELVGFFNLGARVAMDYFLGDKCRVKREVYEEVTVFYEINSGNYIEVARLSSATVQEGILRLREYLGGDRFVFTGAFERCTRPVK